MDITEEDLPAASAAVSSAAFAARAADVIGSAEPAAASEAAVEGMRPAGLLWLPMWITPRRNVPVVMTSLLQRMVSPACTGHSLSLHSTPVMDAECKAMAA